MNIVLVADPSDSWIGSFEGVSTVDPGDYLANPDWSLKRATRIYNLCRSYSYQSIGYYVSLLAEARGQRPIPDVLTIQDLRGNSALRLLPQHLDDLIQKSFANLASDEFVFSVYFGANLAHKHARLAKELYGLFQSPLMRFRFVRGSKWRMRSASAIGLQDIPNNHRDFVVEAAKALREKTKAKAA